MKPEFGWLNFSDSDSSALDSALNELGKGSVEQLGFAGPRNMFRDKLFPGAAAPLTRYRYHFFSLYLLHGFYELQKHETSRQSADKTFLHWQKRLIGCLRADGKNKAGILGTDQYAANQPITRLPLRLYWGNLSLYGLASNPSAMAYDEHCTALDEKARSKVANREDGAKSTDVELVSPKMDGIHKVAEEFLHALVNQAPISFRFDKAERKLIRNMILQSEDPRIVNSLLKRMVQDRQYWGRALDWPEVYQLYRQDTKLTSECRNTIAQAYFFNRLMGVAYAHYYARLFSENDSELMKRIKELQDQVFRLKREFGDIVSRTEELLRNLGRLQPGRLQFLRDTAVYFNHTSKSISIKATLTYIQFLQEYELTIKGAQGALLSLGPEPQEWSADNYTYAYGMNLDMVLQFLTDLKG